jgi:hypothetical protein
MLANLGEKIGADIVSTGRQTRGIATAIDQIHCAKVLKKTQLIFGQSAMVIWEITSMKAPGGSPGL